MSIIPTKLGQIVRPGRAAEVSKKLYADLQKGATIDHADLHAMGFQAMRSGTMDAIDPAALQTTASVTNPVQFLQTMLPGVVRIMQAPLKLDETIGYTQAGAWEDAQIVQRVTESTGFVREYGDYQAKPNTSWNMNFAVQSVVRFEAGVETQRLQAARAARVNISDIDEKTESATLLLQQILNYVGYNGYNSGNNLTYGYLNNPNLPAPVTVAATGTGASTLWSTKDWLNKQADLIAMASDLNIKSKGRADLSTMPSTLNIPNSIAHFFSSTTTFGNQSLLQWFKESYPLARIVQSPNMDLANGGLNLMYWFVDSFPESGTDDGSVFMQVIPTRMIALGTEQIIGGYKTGYSAATAGTFCKRPIGVTIATGM